MVAVDTTERLEAGGVVAAQESASISSRIVATIVGVRVKAGDRVRAGDVLVTLDARDVTAHTGQARADADYFVAIAGRAFSDDEAAQLHAGVLKAYRWQYIVSGVMEPRFQKALFTLLNDEQAARVQRALAPLMDAVPQQADVALPMAA